MITVDAALTEARARGLIGPSPLALQTAHARGFLDALSAVEAPRDVRPADVADADTSTIAHAAVRGVTKVVDLGSGGGLPALVLAAALPEAAFVLVEAAQRRCRHLEWAVEELGWGDRVRVCHGRAEDLARDVELREWADLVTSRSFAPPGVTAECARGFLSGGAHLVVSEPPEGGSRWPSEGLLALAFAPTAVEVRLDVGRFIVLTAVGRCPQGVPRRSGIPAKRPRF